MLKLSRNLALPVLAPWFARSFWAQVLAVLVVTANAAGIDLFSHLGAMGLGSSHDEVLANGDRVISAWQQIAPLILGLWAWFERLAPRYRLGLPDKT